LKASFRVFGRIFWRLWEALGIFGIFGVFGVFGVFGRILLHDIR